VQHLANNTRQKKTRQRNICRVFFIGHQTNLLPGVFVGTRQKKVTVTAPPLAGFFAGCQGGGTRQIYIFIFATASFAGCLLMLAPGK